MDQSPEDEDFSTSSSFGMELSSLNSSTTTTPTSNNTLNTTLNEIITSGRDENLAKVEIAILSIILILAIVGNGLMLIALRKILQYRPMSRMYFFMLHLSCADLLVAFGNILPQLCWDITFRFKGPDLLCRVVKFLQVFVLYLSTYVLTSMAIDRYLVICHHNFSRNYYGALKGPKVLVFTSYIISFVLASPQAFIFSMKYIEEVPGKMILDCWVDFGENEARAYVTYFVMFAFGLPVLIIGFSYGAICLKVVRYRLPEEPKKETKSSSRKLEKPSMSSTSDIRSKSYGESEPATFSKVPLNQKVSTQRNALQRQISQAKIKTVKLSLTIFASFFICWGPFCITQILVAYSSPNIGPVHVIMLLLASLNSCTNPWIYLIFSESLCNQLRIYLGLSLKRGSDEESIGDEAKDQKGNRPGKDPDGLDLPKMNPGRKPPLRRTSLGRDSPPSEQCGKPETKSDIL